MPVRSISLETIEKWKVARGAQVAPRTFNKTFGKRSTLHSAFKREVGIKLGNFLDCLVRPAFISTSRLSAPLRCRERYL